jgi:hypothetical protein
VVGRQWWGDSGGETVVGRQWWGDSGWETVVGRACGIGTMEAVMLMGRDAMGTW